VSDRDADQVPDPAGRATCTECGNPLAPDQRYCLNCGTRRGRLPGAVGATVAAITAKGKGIAAAAGAAVGSKPKEGGDGEDGGWPWMPSPAAIAIAVIGMLALGVGLGSAMSEIASSAPISTILLEYPSHASEAPPAEEPEEAEEAPVVAESTGEAPPAEIATEPLAPETFEEPFLEGGEEEATPAPPEKEEESALQKSIRETEENEAKEAEEGTEEALPEPKHLFLIVLGESGYDQTFGAASSAPYLSRVLPKKGELLPNYYGVTGGVLANEIAMLSGQGPTPETAVNCPNYGAIAPGTVSAVAGQPGQILGNGCVYANTVESLPTQLSERKVTWRSYVEDMEKGGELGQPWTCRKPTLGGPDSSPLGLPGDQYTTWRNPVVFFGKVAESEECGKVDVGFERLTKDLKYKNQTPTLSLIYPNACHAGAEVECEPGAPSGANGAAQLLKTLVPAIMASPAYEEGGMIMITSAAAPQAGAHPDPTACCLAPTYPNLPVPAVAPTPVDPAATTTTPTATSTALDGAATAEEEETPTKYTEESVLNAGGGGKVGLLIISPYVEAGRVEEFEYANHFTLLKTLEKMLGTEPLGYATEATMPTLSSNLFRSQEEVEAEALKKKEAEKRKRIGALSRLPRSAVGPPAPVERRRGTS
jgi:phosphatidylinositol-3-phosphatase